jgi:Cellulose biosynthesis protein BcsS
MRFRGLRCVAGGPPSGVLMLRLLALPVMLALMPCPSAQAQRFIPIIGGGSFTTPEASGRTPDSAPPDLDEPEIGEDPETAPFPAAPEPSAAGKTRVLFQGQRHEAFAPLTLGQRLRRALRASPLGGGHDIWFQRSSPRTVYFMAFESSAHDRFASLGAKYAVRGTLDAPGWRFLTTLGVKIAAFDPTRNTRTSHLDIARMMPGYEMRMGSLTLSAYGGLGYARSSFSGMATTGRVGRYGVSAMGEFWQDWSRMAPAWGRFTAGYVLLDSANRSAAAGLRHGFAMPVLPLLMGPEASWSAGRDVRAQGSTLHSAYCKRRLGLHASDIPLLAARLRVSAGAEWRSNHKRGGYAEVAAHLAY